MIKPSFERYRAGTAYLNLKLGELVERNKAEEVPVTLRALKETGDWYLDRRLPVGVLPITKAFSKAFEALGVIAAVVAVASGLASVALGSGGRGDILGSLRPLLEDASVASFIAFLLMIFLAALAAEAPYFLFMSEKEAAAYRESRMGLQRRHDTETQKQVRAEKAKRRKAEDRAVLDAFENRKEGEA